MKIKTLGVLVILLPLLATGCKQANTPTVEVPAVPEVEVPEVELIEIDISLISSTDIKPEHENILLALGLWEVSSGEFAISNRTITVKDGTYKSEIAKTIQEKLKVDNVSVAFEDSNLILKAETGFIFSNGKKEISTPCNFLVGTFIVETEDDFQKTLDVLSTQTGDITLDIVESITKTDELGNKVPFEINGGTIEKPLNLTLETSNENGAEVNGGGILTSLIVSGQNTTVTVGEGITINGGYKDAVKDGNGGGVTVTDGATFILDGGTIEGNFSEVNDYTKGGGAVSILNGTFTMNSGTIKDNTAFRGAGVYLHAVDEDKTSTFIMNGGSIENNTTIIEKDGTINAATGGGSGVFVYGSNAHFIMGKDASSDGSIPTIKGNVASRMGSAITLSTNGSATIYNGLITENIGPYSVIGMAAGGTFNMSGGQITKNVYGPTLEDGTPDASRISLVDVLQIKSYILDADGNEISHSIVADHSGNKLLGTIDWDKAIIEGAGA